MPRFLKSWKVCLKIIYVQRPSECKSADKPRYSQVRGQVGEKPLMLSPLHSTGHRKSAARTNIPCVGHLLVYFSAHKPTVNALIYHKSRNTIN